MALGCLEVAHNTELLSSADCTISVSELTLLDRFKIVVHIAEMVESINVRRGPSAFHSHVQGSKAGDSQQDSSSCLIYDSMDPMNGNSIQNEVSTEY